jgi:hypothetical protein
MMNMLMRKTAANILFILLIYQPMWGQTKSWVYLRPSENPVQQATHFMDSLRTEGVTVYHYSHWLHAFSAGLDPSCYHQLSTHPGIEFVQKMDSRLVISSSKRRVLYTRSTYAGFRQLKGNYLQEQGYRGSDLKIGIIDAEFSRADKVKALKTWIQKPGKVVTRNYIDSTASLYKGKKFGHGAGVWFAIARWAPQAEFALAYTDRSDKEYRGEEDNWIAALEWMHGQGVQLVNTSLGYATGFDNPEENYAPDQMDGVSTAISRVASIAVKEKGMLLVVSAGNEGGYSFKTVSAPADAEGVISVGATRGTTHLKAGFSSIGDMRTPWLKPDVSCNSRIGTSFSAPQITGLAALLWQRFPEKSNLEIREAILRSGSIYTHPNRYIGHGIPDVHRAIALLHGEEPTYPVQKITLNKSERRQVRVGVNRYCHVHHKSDPLEVARQVRYKPYKRVITLQYEPGISFSTWFFPDGSVLEVEWVEEE